MYGTEIELPHKIQDSLILKLNIFLFIDLLILLIFIDLYFNSAFEANCSHLLHCPRFLLCFLKKCACQNSPPTSKVCAITYFFLSGISFTNIHNTQDIRGKGRLSLNSFLPLHPLHKHFDILQRPHLCTQVAAGLEPETFSIQAQVINH